MSEDLKLILTKAIDSNNIVCEEVDTVDIRRVSKFSYGVFNPEDDQNN